MDFIQSLRHHGLPVSPAETLDALQAVAAVGVGNRERLKTTLGLTLAKSLADRGQLEELFDRFFEPPKTAATPLIQFDAPADIDAPVAPGTNSIHSELGQLLLRNDQPTLQRQLVIAAEQAGAKDMQMFLQKKMVSNRILMDMGDRQLQKELRQLESRQQQLQLVAELQQQRQQLIDTINDYVEQQFLLYSRNRGSQLSEVTLQQAKLSNLDSVQLQQLMRLVHKIAKKLASLHSRTRKVSKRGCLDMRRTIAANAALDGHLLHTRWKSTRIERPRVMVICDISGSVSTYARFLLLFVYALQDVLPRVRSFVFSNQMHEVTSLFRELQPEAAISQVIERWSGFSTDYGRALQDFSALALSQVDSKTQVIMLGDARNNHDLGRADIWKEVHNRAQRVLWLNPEDRSRWNTGDSIMRLYAPYCSMLETCNSLRDMERVLGRLLKYAN